MLVSAFKMATVREGFTVEEQFSIVRSFFLWAKEPSAKYIPVYNGKCLSRKAVHNWVAKVSLMTKRLIWRCGNDRDNSQETSVLRVSTHW
jgi:hypothetical protein